MASYLLPEYLRHLVLDETTLVLLDPLPPLPLLEHLEVKNNNPNVSAGTMFSETFEHCMLQPSLQRVVLKKLQVRPEDGKNNPVYPPLDTYGNPVCHLTEMRLLDVSIHVDLLEQTLGRCYQLQSFTLQLHLTQQKYTLMQEPGKEVRKSS